MPTPQTEQEQSLADYDSLVTEDVYLSAGVHIGTQQKNADMKDFIYRVRNDGLFVLDVKKTDQRIRAVVNFVSKYPPEKVLFVSARQYGQKPIRMLAKTLGAITIAGRFMPGTLTNPQTTQFMEPEVVVLTDPSPTTGRVTTPIVAATPAATTNALQPETRAAQTARNPGRTFKTPPTPAAGASHRSPECAVHAKARMPVRPTWTWPLETAIPKGGKAARPASVRASGHGATVPSSRRRTAVNPPRSRPRLTISQAARPTGWLANGTNSRIDGGG